MYIYIDLIHPPTRMAVANNGKEKALPAWWLASWGVKKHIPRDTCSPAEVI